MKDFQDIDAHLEDWSALRSAIDFSGILIGNGASRTIWEDFAYDSLFENARTVEEKPLSQSELSVFDALQTRSFEQALSALKTTSRVNKALAVSSAAPRNRYYAIKEALINTIHAVHIPWRLVQPSTLATINRELAKIPGVVVYRLVTRPWRLSRGSRCSLTVRWSACWVLQTVQVVMLMNLLNNSSLFWQR